MVNLLLAVMVAGSLSDWVSQCQNKVSDSTVASTSGATTQEAIESGADILSQYGALRVDGVADESDCEVLLQKLEHEYPRKPTGEHMNHLNVGIVIDEKVRTLMEKSIERIYPLINQLVGANGLVEELAFMINDPGAKYQTWHADTVYTPKTAKMYSFFIALENITLDMGPTEVAPGITTPEMIKVCEEDMSKSKISFCRNTISSVPNIGATMKAGDVLIMDSICQHRASENLSDKRRRLFYYTLASQDGERPDGSTFTLLHPYKSKLQLSDYRAWGDFEFPTRQSMQYSELDEDEM
eukprot:TRINITY_DN3179_c4_g1_i1.p1 TRINITY_DN3179_c4_g1~~TRINITY_DN3179_c4_g1_i1.p1  ORF type:complete len:314 (+),score=49.16 TRINITY_DN3179_c4_g1_i1:52-942(+)